MIIVILPFWLWVAWLPVALTLRTLSLVLRLLLATVRHDLAIRSRCCLEEAADVIDAGGIMVGRRGWPVSRARGQQRRLGARQ